MQVNSQEKMFFELVMKPKFSEMKEGFRLSLEAGLMQNLSPSDRTLLIQFGEMTNYFFEQILTSEIKMGTYIMAWSRMAKVLQDCLGFEEEHLIAMIKEDGKFVREAEERLKRETRQ